MCHHMVFLQYLKTSTSLLKFILNLFQPHYNFTYDLNCIDRTAVLGWKGVVTEKENPINSFMEVLIRVTHIYAHGGFTCLVNTALRSLTCAFVKTLINNHIVTTFDLLQLL